MKGMLSPDSGFSRVFGGIADMFLLTVMWVIGCLPIFTIVTSTASLYHATVKCIRFEAGKPIPEFWDAYKKNLKQGTGLFLVYFVILAILGSIFTYSFFMMRMQTPFTYILTNVSALSFLLLIFNLVWIAPIFSRFSKPMGTSLKNIYVLSFRHMVQGLGMVFIFIVMAAAAWFIPPMTLITPCLCAFLSSFLAEPVLRKYMPPQTEEIPSWCYGMKD